MLSVMLSDIMLSAIVLSVIMFSVVAPLCHLIHFKIKANILKASNKRANKSKMKLSKNSKKNLG